MDYDRYIKAHPVGKFGKDLCRDCINWLGIWGEDGCDKLRVNGQGLCPPPMCCFGYVSRPPKTWAHLNLNEKLVKLISDIVK